MALASGELYELFLSLSARRLAAAKQALELRPEAERRAALIAALAPIAVDAGLLGSEGVSALASALARAKGSELTKVRAGLAELERAIASLGVSDASGARVNETELLNTARALLENGALGFTLLSDEAAPETVESQTAATSDGDDSRWAPSLAEDMIGDGIGITHIDTAAGKTYLTSMLGQLIVATREQHKHRVFSLDHRDEYGCFTARSGLKQADQLSMIPAWCRRHIVQITHTA